MRRQIVEVGHPASSVSQQRLCIPPQDHNYVLSQSPRQEIRQRLEIVLALL
ncbi:hypothetical protein E4U46_004410 [Claviceps purpurea]|nr:hypothetical protein E4U46_004410 [Claviceps purpurea]